MRKLIVSFLLVSFLFLSLTTSVLAGAKKYLVYAFFNELGAKRPWRITLTVYKEPVLLQRARVWKVDTEDGIIYWLPVDQTVVMEVPN